MSVRQASVYEDNKTIETVPRQYRTTKEINLKES